MKKILSLMIIVFSTFFLASCEDQKYADDAVNVIFFTANFGATYIEPYLFVEPGATIEKPEDPSRQGYNFMGWYRDLNYTEPYDFEADVVTDTTMILYAKWEAAVLNIYYELYGGEFVGTTYPTTFFAGETKVLPQATRTGYLFVSWYTYPWVDESSTKPGDAGLVSIPNTVYEDLYIYAHWEAIKVSVSFRINYPLTTGAPANVNSRTVPYGTVIDFPVLADTDLYEFVGWNSRSDGTGIYYVNGDVFVRTQRLTVYAIWQLK
jgi:uncharacterized repeat protein (TIGR02543 family)